MVELRGHCILVPAKHNFSHLHKTDDIIKWIHPVLSPEFDACTSFETKLKVLLKIKEKWTLTELETMLKDLVEPEQSLASML